MRTDRSGANLWTVPDAPAPISAPSRFRLRHWCRTGDGESWRSLMGRYLIGLAAIAVVAVGGTMLISSSLTRQETSASLAATAARQNLLSYEITQAARDAASPDAETRRGALAALEAARRRLHAGPPGRLFESVEVDHGRAESIVAGYVALAGAIDGVLTDGVDAPLSEPSVIELERRAELFRLGMDGLLFDVHQQAQAGADSARRAEFALLGITLALLAVQALFLFRPALRRLRRAISERAERHAQERDEELQRRRQAEQFDPLTGLANRSLLADRLRGAMARARRDGGVVALLLLDVDHFKTVNDRFGPEVGDSLLVMAARRFGATVRESDTVARLGGDEFAVVLEGAQRAEDAGRVAAKMLAALEAPFELEGRRLYVSASIGIVVYPLDGDQVDELLRDADIAMYTAKEAGRNRYQFFTRELREQTSERLSLLEGLRSALERPDELKLVYQPKIDVATGEVIGVEALLRWDHPELGIVLPGRFIPLAEETDLIVPLGRWVIDEACAQAQRWRRSGQDKLKVSVNVSSRQFRQGDLVETIAQALNDAGLDPSWLEVELTEGTLLEDTTMVQQTLERLKAMGVQVSIDDFGTGYSSLNYLKRFPIDTLKIDRSFISDITSDHDDAAISQAIVSLARSLRLQVVAEGVETTEQLEAVRSLGCDIAQGFLISRPLDADAVDAFVVRIDERAAV